MAVKMSVLVFWILTQCEHISSIFRAEEGGGMFL
jgi:hypothetical protein